MTERLAPMLCDDANETQLPHLLTSDDWVASQKIDGQRLLVQYDGRLIFVNRSGDPAALTKQTDDMLRSALPKDVNFDYCLDGELMMVGRLPVLWLFDMPYGPIPGGPVREHLGRRYIDRLDVLQTLVDKHSSPVVTVTASALIKAVPVATTTDEKWDLVRWLATTGGEGVVFRHRASPYRPGKRSEQCLRWKFTKTVDVVCYDDAPDGDRDCVAVGCFDEDLNLVHVGRVSTHGKEDVAIDDVLELRCLYASEDLKLVQPRIVRTRDDKRPVECSLEQVRAIVTNPKIHVPLPTGEPPSTRFDPPLRKHRRTAG